MKSIIRVLHILHAMGRGGAETMLMNYYRNIDRTKVQFDFLLTEQNHCDYEDEILEMGGRIYRVPLLKLPNPFLYIKGVRNFLKQHPEYKIVHSHTSSKSAIPLWVAKTCGVPVRVCHAHSSNSGRGFEGMVRRGLCVWLKRVATDYMSCGFDAAYCWYGKKIVEQDRVMVTPNAVDCDKYSFDEITRDRVRNKCSISSNTLVLGMVSRFHPVKNHLFVLDVLSELVSRGINVKLLLVGDGQLHAEIEEKAKTLDILDNIVFTGIVNDVHNYLQAMDLVLMPSFNEGLPVSLIEAQAVGLKCLVSTGVPSEVNITGLVDFLPLSKGAETWAKELLRLSISSRPSADKIQMSLRSAGYEIQTAAKKLEEWYTSKA